MHYKIVIVTPVDEDQNTEEDAIANVEAMLSSEYERLSSMMDAYEVLEAERVRKEEVMERLSRFYDDEFEVFSRYLNVVRERINRDDRELFNDEGFRDAAYRLNPYMGWHLDVFDDNMEHMTPDGLEKFLKQISSPEVWLVYTDLHY